MPRLFAATPLSDHPDCDSRPAPRQDDVAGLGPTAMQWAHDVIQSGLERLETVATGTAGRYCVKDELSIADACLVPQLYNARRFSVDVAQFPTLAAIEQACLELQAFQDAAPEASPDAELP
jgi:glutathione S-transferase